MEISILRRKACPTPLQSVRQQGFAILAFDVDNGAEFLNHHLWRYFTQRRQPVGLSRSRPYQKKDQAHVEQKNWTHVRQLPGYQRIEDRSLKNDSISLEAGRQSM